MRVEGHQCGYKYRVYSAPLDAFIASFYGFCKDSAENFAGIACGVPFYVNVFSAVLLVVTATELQTVSGNLTAGYVGHIWEKG